MDIKYVVMIQCDISRKRCSGFASPTVLLSKDDVFKDDDSVRYIAMTCGGCCGAGLASLLEHFSNKLKKKTDVTKDEVAVHLSSCMVTDNYHHDRCPHVDYIKTLVEKKKNHNIIEGTYISKTSAKKRENGEYKCY